MVLQKLSVEQNEAVFDENNVLLTAIPGSGKTRTLTNKVLKELQEEIEKTKNEKEEAVLNQKFEKAAELRDRKMVW